MTAFTVVSSAAKPLAEAQAESKTADKILIPTLFITIILQIDRAAKPAQSAWGGGLSALFCNHK
ncbi:hypothetical protein [Rhizobium ecuadorense]|uniref:hypothetical protein n=1 Tax=Rhizobium ecuadorense TaxID=1671795 RepID=UPI001FCDECCF|nr:hypothetical protein [Rhizobium ecuadorense]